ncbi:MAG: Dam family site-specific DNA-(adenine-N6)-methyltransferase [Verrucomicrobia bacterium]|nr:Dam family site-specific DNA-(adenine-N6)-methyltransferase [Verrucomicrobiota bacterium]
MSKVFVPPIKCQGIKTKLAEWILAQVTFADDGCWIEPFMGSGVIGFNLRPKSAIFADKNPHLIRFYRAIQSGEITPARAKVFLESEGAKLSNAGQSHFNAVRARFNKEGSPWDFLFLNRSCFNGIIRFNSKGGFNTPYGHKPERFAQAYVTKIVNQIDYVSKAMRNSHWEFVCADFRDIINRATKNDLIYCDPPYLGRHVDYFDSWREVDERDLAALLAKTKALFIISTWHSNQYRKNTSLKKFWSDFTMLTREHFYHVGGKEENRNPMLEALVMNFEPGVSATDFESSREVKQLALMEKPVRYRVTTSVSTSRRHAIKSKC